MVGPSTRFETIRRIYFYLVALISLVAGLIALSGMLHGLTLAWSASGAGIRAGEAEFVRMLLARNGGLLVVTTPIFLLHWWYVQHRLVLPNERAAGVRKFYLYAASTAALIVALGNLQALTSALLQALFDPHGTMAVPVGWLQQIGMVAAGLGLLAYQYQVLQRDGDYGREHGSALLWRRLFLTLAGLVGVVVLALGAAGVTRVFVDAGLSQVVPDVGALWTLALAQSAATLLVGALLVHVVGRQWQMVMEINDEDGTSAWRRLYLFGAVIIGAVATLTPAALILREGLLLLLGDASGSTAELLASLVEPLAFVPVGLSVWLAYHRRLQWEQDRYGDTAESITIGRIYNYLVAATALVLLWFGSIEVLQAFIDAGFSRGAVVARGTVWVQPLATGLSLFAVAMPVWLLHWRAVQSIARQDNDTGAHERTAMTRRVFLFGLAFVSAILVLVFLAQVIYRVFLLLLGAPDAGLWSAAAADELARAAVSAVIWFFTVITIRTDSRMPEPATRSDVPAKRRATLEARIGRLEAELNRARQELAELPVADDGAGA